MGVHVRDTKEPRRMGGTGYGDFQSVIFFGCPSEMKKTSEDKVQIFP